MYLTNRYSKILKEMSREGSNFIFERENHIRFKFNGLENLGKLATPFFKKRKVSKLRNGVLTIIMGLKMARAGAEAIHVGRQHSQTGKQDRLTRENQRGLTRRLFSVEIQNEH